MAWHLNPALSTLRAEVNDAYPGRDKDSDGTIGDPVHAARTSDHNPDGDGSVDAWDMDVEVRGPGQAYALDVDRIKAAFERHPSASYWIHDDRIAMRSEGWQPRSYAYAGPSRNQHRKHVHFNTRASHERVTSPFGISTEDTVTPGEFLAIIRNDQVAAELSRLPWAFKPAGHPEGTTAHAIVLNGHTASLSALQPVPATLVAQGAAIESLAALVAAGNGDLDVAAIVTQVRAHIDAKLAELPPVIADAVVDEIAS